MKCNNCANDAHYYVNDPGANEVLYCDVCLPEWLRTRAAEGQFALPVAESKKAKAAEADVSESN